MHTIMEQIAINYDHARPGFFAYSTEPSGFLKELSFLQDEFDGFEELAITFFNILKNHHWGCTKIRYAAPSRINRSRNIVLSFQHGVLGTSSAEYGYISQS